MDFAMIGPAVVLAMGCLGSAIGCGIAGMASHGAIARAEENHGKFIAMSAIPSSQAIYGFVLMLLMKNAILANTLSAWNGIGIGISIGIAIMVSAVYQGLCAATGIQAASRQSGIYGKCLAAVGIVESFSLFAFVFALLLI